MLTSHVIRRLLEDAAEVCRAAIGRLVERFVPDVFVERVQREIDGLHDEIAISATLRDFVAHVAVIDEADSSPRELTTQALYKLAELGVRAADTREERVLSLVGEGVH